MKLTLLTITGFAMVLAMMLFHPLSPTRDAHAQDPAASFVMDMKLLNRTPGARNPDFKSLHSEIFRSRTLDSNRQLVGALKDLKIDESGTIVKIISEITWVRGKPREIEHFPAEVVFMEGKNAWEVPLLFEGEAVMSPEMLANIAPAAGGKVYQIRDLFGADIRSDSGRMVAEVKDVLLDREATKIEALLITSVAGASHYDEITVPFDGNM